MTDDGGSQRDVAAGVALLQLLERRLGAVAPEARREAQVDGKEEMGRHREAPQAEERNEGRVPPENSRQKSGAAISTSSVSNCVFTRSRSKQPPASSQPFAQIFYF